LRLGCANCGTEEGGGCGTGEESQPVGTVEDVGAVMNLLPLNTLIEEARQFWKEEDMDIPSKKQLWELYFNVRFGKFENYFFCFFRSFPCCLTDIYLFYILISLIVC
jgi:hypothetical protein